MFRFLTNRTNHNFIQPAIEYKRHQAGEYYDKVITHIRDADEIDIFGPDAAKHELQKRLKDEGLFVHGKLRQFAKPRELTGLAIFRDSTLAPKR